MDEHPLSEAQMDLIAEKAADRALQKIYADIGQNLLKKMAWFAGVIFISLALFLAGKGALKP